MINQPKGGSMTPEELEELNKKDSKYDTDHVTQVCQWLCDVAAHGNFSAPDFGNHSENSVQEALRDGVFLLQVLQAINPANTTKISSSKHAFEMMENINKFLEGLTAMGIPKIDLFQTLHLFEGSNMPQVISSMAAFGRKAQTSGYDGPTLDPSPAIENKRGFTDKKLSADGSLLNMQPRGNRNPVNFGKHRSK